MAGSPTTNHENVMNHAAANNSQHFDALKQSAFEKFITAPIGSDEYGVALTEYGHAVEDECRALFNLAPKHAPMSTNTQEQDLANVTHAHNAWMCFEAASVGYKFKEAAQARAYFDKLAREYKEKYGETWDGVEVPEAPPTTAADCEMFHADGLTPEQVRVLYGEDAERVYGDWIYANLK
jgi:hypothetical protein